MTNNKSRKRQKTIDNNESDISVTIIKTYKNTSEPKRRSEKFPRKIDLNKVRTKLSKKHETDSDSNLYMGTNCRFLNFKTENAEIEPNDELKFNLYDIVEIVEDKDKDVVWKLHIIQNIEFDLTELNFEKGFKLNEDGSIIPAYAQAFEILESKINKNYMTYEDIKVYECNHEITTECKRSFIFNFNFLSYENSNQRSTENTTKIKYLCGRVQKGEITLSNIKLTKRFIMEVENVFEICQDKKRELLKISEKYGHFYARSLILGGSIIKCEKYNQNSDDPSKTSKTNIDIDIQSKDFERFGSFGSFDSFGENFKLINKAQLQVQAQTSNENTNKFHEICKKYNLVIIGGIKNDNVWRESLEDGANWKIIGYDKIFPLFELLEEPLKNKVLGVLNHQILKEGIDEIDFNLEKYKKDKDKKPLIHRLSSYINDIRNISECNILASIVSENNNVFSLHVEYMNEDKNHPVFVVHHIQEEKKFFFRNIFMHRNVKIKLCWIIVGPPTSFNCFDFDIDCSLLLKSEKSILQDKDNCIINNCGKIGTCVLEISNKESSSSNNLYTENNTSNVTKYNPYRSRYVIGNYFNSVESARLFIYDIKERKKVTEETILKRLALYSCTPKMYEEKKIEWKNNNEIFYGEKIFNLNDDLILVNQKCTDCTTCEHHGFVNIIPDKIIYGSLNSKSSDLEGSVVYFTIPRKKITKIYLQNDKKSF